jgi:plastocyanin
MQGAKPRKSQQALSAVIIILLMGMLNGCDLLKSLYGTNQGGSGNRPPIATQTVQISNFSFQLSTIRIKAGTTVTWIQKDSAIHTVTSTNPAGLFDSRNLAQGQQFTFTFSNPGTYEYQCSIHTSMTGKVIVE